MQAAASVAKLRGHEGILAFEAGDVKISKERRPFSCIYFLLKRRSRVAAKGSDAVPDEGGKH